MFLPFTGEAPIVPEPIQIVIEVKQKEEEPKEPEIKEEDTLLYKIENDVNNCEPERYIRADNAECGDIRPEYRVATPRSTQSTVATQTPARTAQNPSSGWYPYGQCTYYVWSKRSVGQWNNASEWLWQAQRDGYATGSTPRVGAIAWESGHVSYVESVNDDGTITVSEMNYRGIGVISIRTTPANQFMYIY